VNNLISSSAAEQSGMPFGLMVIFMPPKVTGC